MSATSFVYTLESLFFNFPPNTAVLAKKKREISLNELLKIQALYTTRNESSNEGDRGARAFF